MLLWIIPVSLVVLIFLLAWGAYCKTFFQNRRKKENIYALPKKTPEPVARRTRDMIGTFDQVSYEAVEIRSADGLRLFGRYYHVRDGAPLHIQLHGYRSYAMRDFCGGNPLVREHGHNTLVVDQRAHGKSEGHTISFGVHERVDCLMWAEYAARRFGSETPIFLTGVSMGAATVLMASALPLPKNVVGIIADCPYSSPREIIRKVIGDMKLPVSVAYPFVRLGAFLFGGIRGLDTVSAAEAVKKSNVPILIIHGEADAFVPCEMSREIAKNSPNVRLETFPDADHAMSYMTDTERYARVSIEFAEECLARFADQSSKEE